MATWSLVVLIGGVDYSARLAGRVDWQGAANAARTGSVRLSLAAGTINLDAFRGVAVTINAVWNGTSYRRFTGWVAKPAWDGAEQILSLSLSDRFQNYWRSLYVSGGRAALLAALSGSRWSDSVHASGVSAGDGWDVASKLFETAPYSASLSHSGSLRWLPWAGGAVVATLSAAAGTTLGDAPPTIDLVDVESIANRVDVAFEALDYRLHEWIIDIGWASPSTDLCGDYRDKPWWLPTRDIIRSAASGAGDWSIVQFADDLGGGPGGMVFVGLPASGTYYCDSVPFSWILSSAKAEGESLVVSANWQASRRWVQRAVRIWQMVVEAPDSVAAYGALFASDSASADAGSDATGGWDQSKTARRPDGDWVAAGTSHAWLDTGSLADAVAGAECLAWLKAVSILADHRRNRLDCPALPGDLLAVPGGGSRAVATLDIGDRVQVQTAPLSSPGVVEQISEYWDISTGDCQTTLSLAVSQCPGAGGADDTIAAEELVPEMAATLEGSITLQTHIGGKDDSPAFSAAWRGWVTDLEVPLTTDAWRIYGKKDFLVECPDVPAALRDTDATAEQVVTFRVYPPNDELIIVRA